MSVAFCRESDEEHLEPKFELPIPPGPNFVTPDGMTQIERRVAELELAVEATLDEEPRKLVRRDLRYWRNRLASAQSAPAPRAGKVGIGSRVRFTLRGKPLEVRIAAMTRPIRRNIASPFRLRWRAHCLVARRATLPTSREKPMRSRSSRSKTPDLESFLTQPVPELPRFRRREASLESSGGRCRLAATDSSVASRPWRRR